MSQPPDIAILGPGLLGGSVALSAKAYGCAGSVHIWARREAAVEEVRSLGIADLASTDLARVVAGAQLIILATPVGIMRGLVGQLVELGVAPGTLITDLGSVKGSVVSGIDALLEGNADLSFVGSHPMAGKEQAGIEHATAELFRGAACVITPGASSTTASTEAVETFWQQLGCRTLRMEAGLHDQAVAKVSHLPHLAASLITASALGGDPAVGEVAGAGLRDTTRVASGPPTMWAEILLENRDALAPALEDLARRLGETIGLLEAGDREKLQALLAEAKDLRDAL